MALPTLQLYTSVCKLQGTCSTRGCQSAGIIGPPKALSCREGSCTEDEDIEMQNKPELELEGTHEVQATLSYTKAAMRAVVFSLMKASTAFCFACWASRCKLHIRGKRTSKMSACAKCWNFVWCCVEDSRKLRKRSVPSSSISSSRSCIQPKHLRRQPSPTA